MFTRKAMPDERPDYLIHPVPARPSLSEALAQPAQSARNLDPAESSSDGVVTIGKGARVSGHVADCRKLDVFGVIEADVIAELVVIHEGGGLRGNVQTDRAEVRGVLEGTLQVYEHLAIHSSGDINGEVTYGTLSVEAGAKVIGSVRTQTGVRPAGVEAAPAYANNDRGSGLNGAGDHPLATYTAVRTVSGGTSFPQ